MYLAHISPSSPQAGFKLNEKSLDLNRSCVLLISHHISAISPLYLRYISPISPRCVLLISHSGGTFGTLNCANLLKVRAAARGRGGVGAGAGVGVGLAYDSNLPPPPPLPLPLPLPLLQGFTEDIFCLTSEWDTCIARSHLPCISLLSP